MTTVSSNTLVRASRREHNSHQISRSDMRKEIFINSSVGETRIAILEDGKLVELLTERPENERMVGDIYLGKVVNVVKGMRAAFVDIGDRKSVV